MPPQHYCPYCLNCTPAGPTDIAHMRLQQCSRTPFCACMRFSACWNTTLYGASMTASSHSTPRSAGRQCMNMALLPVRCIIASSTCTATAPRSNAAALPKPAHAPCAVLQRVLVQLDGSAL